MRNKKGFTIVEVSLVLAIAGLIFLMVFIAVPSLQTQQRDTQRREDVTKVVKLITDYQANHRGALPESNIIDEPTEDGSNTYESIRCGDDENNDDWDTLYCKYLGEEFADPDGDGYRLLVGYCQENGSAVPDKNCSIPGMLTNEFIGTARLPNDPDVTFPNAYMMTILIGATCNGDTAVGTSNPRKVAVLYKLEGGGTYCANS